MDKEQIKKFMKEVDKTKKPKHWRKFINKNTVTHNLIIKYGKRAFCTHCQKYFDEDVETHPYKKTKCKRCEKEYYVRNHNIRSFRFGSDIGFFTKVNGKIVLRVFEIESKYNFKTKKFTHSLQEFLRFIPGEGYFINNTLHFFYYDIRIDHSEKITCWRKYRGNKLIYDMPIYPYNKKYLYKNTPLEYVPLNEVQQKYKYYSNLEILNIANNESFEYLWKMGLYQLSKNAKCFKNKGSFKKTFGIPKSFFKFMLQNNIDYIDYKILKLLQIQDIELIKKYRYYDYNYLAFMKKQGYLENEKILEKYKYYESDLRTICKYTTLKKFFEYDIGVKNIHIYKDYLIMAKKLGYSIKARDRLFPEDLLKIHDELSKKIKISNDMNTNFKAYSRYLELSKYTYDDGKYIIFPAPSVDDLKDEGEQQDNCVGYMYLEPYINKKTEIFFIRKLEDVTKSFITLEYKNKRVEQKELPHHNKDFTKEQNDFIDKWLGYRIFIDNKIKVKNQATITTKKYSISNIAA